jgi:K+-transporting ATPase ATPase A chain
MSAASWLQFGVLLAVIVATTPILGRYMAAVFGADGDRAPGDRVFVSVERLVYRVIGADPKREQRWQTYAFSLLAFSLCSVLALYVLQRVQAWLPLNPTNVPNVPEALSFNTATSFTTNTNWQNYAPENTVSHLTQMTGLAVQNFVSAAVGIAVAIALVRGLTRQQAATIGNFRVDLTRACIRILAPIAFVSALVFASQGMIQNFQGFTEAKTLEGAN